MSEDGDEVSKKPNVNFSVPRRDAKKLKQELKIVHRLWLVIAELR